MGANNREAAPYRKEWYPIRPHRPGRAHTLDALPQFWQGSRLELEAGGADGGRALSVPALGRDLPQLVSDAGSYSGKMPVQLVGPGSSLLRSVGSGSRPGPASGTYASEPGPEVSAVPRRQLVTEEVTTRFDELTLYRVSEPKVVCLPAACPRARSSVRSSSFCLPQTFRHI